MKAKATKVTLYVSNSCVLPSPPAFFLELWLYMNRERAGRVYLKCGEEIYSSTEGDVLFPIQKVLLKEIFPSNQIAHVKKQNLIMGTRAQAFTAKIKNLQEIQMRLMQGSLPLPQGHEIANSLKYFR